MTFYLKRINNWYSIDCGMILGGVYLIKPFFFGWCKLFCVFFKKCLFISGWIVYLCEKLLK